MHTRTKIVKIIVSIKNGQGYTKLIERLLSSVDEELELANPTTQEDPCRVYPLIHLVQVLVLFSHHKQGDVQALQDTLVYS